MGRRGYPVELRQKAFDLVEAGGRIPDVARELGVSVPTIYAWRRGRSTEPNLSDAQLAACRTEPVASALPHVVEVELIVREPSTALLGPDVLNQLQRQLQRLAQELLFGEAQWPAAAQGSGEVAESRQPAPARAGRAG